MKKYEVNVEKLDNLSIFQLREVGARVGVKNPTTLRTKELKEQIIDVINGKIEPYKKEKSGRPHKSIISDDQWDELVGFKNPFNAFQDQKDVQYLSLYSPTSSVNKRLSDKILTGYVAESFNELIFIHGEPDEIDASKFAKITRQSINSSLVLPGDKITCKIKFEDLTSLNDIPSPEVTEIITINGKRTDPYEATFNKNADLTDGTPITFSLPQLQFINTKCPVYTGQRVYIFGESNSGQTYLANSIAKDLSKDYKVVYLATCKKPEEKLNIENIEYFFTTFDVSPTNLLFNFELALDRAKNLCNNGYKTVFIIDDISSYIINYANALKSKYSMPDLHYDEILQSIKSLCASSKNTVKGSLTTFITGIDNLNAPFNSYLETINTLSTNHIVLSKKDFQENKPEFFVEEKTFANEKTRSNLV